jgi:hypothetical protein
MKQFLLVVTLSLSLTACSLNLAANSISPVPTISQDLIATEQALNTPADPNIDLLRSHYQLNLYYDYAEQQIDVEEGVTYLNTSDVALSEILMIIDAQRQGGEFILQKLAWDDGLLIEDYSLAENILRFELRKSLLPGEAIQFFIDYQLGLPEQAGPIGFSGSQSNFADWYPYIPPYSERDGWYVHPAAEVGEHLVYESADFDVRIDVLNAPETLQIAAPAPATIEGEEMVYSLEGARRFAWSASERFELLEGVALGIPIKAYVFAEHSKAGNAAIQIAAEALETFAQSFGDYPYESLTIVEAQFPDGLESDAFFFLNESFFAAYSGGQQNYLSLLSVHEVAHNWWFGLVGNDPALDPWLDESLAIFSELLFYESKHPELGKWWWNFRILDYAPQGFVNSNIYDHQTFASYVHAVYFRGALFLQDLRLVMGEDDFMDFLNAYIQEGQSVLVSEDIFFDLLMPYELEGLPELMKEYFQQ